DAAAADAEGVAVDSAGHARHPVYDPRSAALLGQRVLPLGWPHRPTELARGLREQEPPFALGPDTEGMGTRPACRRGLRDEAARLAPRDVRARRPVAEDARRDRHPGCARLGMAV